MLAERRLVLPAVAVLGVFLTLTACPLIPERDNFVCGIRANGTINRCDGPGELCLCGAGGSRENRCVTPEVHEVCASGFRFSFPEDDADPECVPEDTTKRFVSARSNALCDSDGEIECGSPNTDGTTLRCGFNQFCYCPSSRCAEPWPSCASDGGLPARLVSTGECVGNFDGGLPAARERPDGFCPGYTLGELFPDGGTGGGNTGGSSP